VRKEVMGRGIAVALLDAFERVIRDNRIEEYGLSVFKTNQRAIHFYEKMGFTVDDENNRSIYFSKRLSPASNERCGDGGGEKC
jgi:ribosomal protein S18 acetylase RimI-like enzyme